jgi:hypothetical protein
MKGNPPLMIKKKRNNPLQKTDFPNSNNPVEQPQATRRDMLLQRALLLRLAAKSPRLQTLLLERCRRDIHFWFDYFCWTFDPREAISDQPFQLYEFQHQALDDICHAINTGEDLLIEKSRDMGISWLILLVFQYYWLFHPGANFHCGSRKQELVDRKGDRSTLLEKIRYNLYRLPHWMKPEGFRENQDDNVLKLLNPANGNSITGESSNENFGRGGRYKAILFDEFPFWPLQDAAYASAGQSSPCRIVVGTPYGSKNRFATLRFGNQVRVLSIHWRQHPYRNEQWYALQQKRLTEDEIARELDINYHLSVKDRVFTTFNDTHKREVTVIPDKKIIRSWDFGYHCPACLFIQLDDQDRVIVLKEVVGHCELAVNFARQVLEISRTYYGDALFEDICDPAGAQHSDKHLQTSIEILNSLGIYPSYGRSLIKDGIELIRMKLMTMEDDQPGLLVDSRCYNLIEAFEGGYRFRGDDDEHPLEEHPYEDVMDCLRYAIMAKCDVIRRKPLKAHLYKAQNRYTAY